MVVDLAREFGVSVLVYSSSQLVQNSFDDPTYKSEFFAGKVAVERYIQSLDEKNLGWVYVNTLSTPTSYALLIMFLGLLLFVVVVEFSALPSSWRALPVNRDRSSPDYSPLG